MKHLTFTACVSISVFVIFVGFVPNTASSNPIVATTELSSSQARSGNASENSSLRRQKKAEAATNVSGHERASSPAAKAATGLTLADILGIFIFLALVVTHFCFCRKGVYPESLPLCEMSSGVGRRRARRSGKADK